ncbi:Fumarylacetoacetase protein [Metarhizium guizhouense ARSEF 977]|uniref:Fumarylacetoacetase protein n=1 Tax=Metarhizium guizhouense (strain ARSEF 977) TaxID=1276136 RepID=A0A0B4GT22_METGA|nr:Fumarylacetoacetase protein [Metarhizium guizhouense ARSEF 977]
MSLSNFIKPHVEREPAFVLKGHLKGPNVTVAIDLAIPAVEIIDSRVNNWAIGLEESWPTIAPRVASSRTAHRATSPS